MLSDKSIVLILCTALTLAAGCDKGIEPTSSSTGVQNPTGWIAGGVTFLHWEAVDTVYDTRIIAFRSFPPDDIINSVLRGEAVVYPPIGETALAPAGADSVKYLFSLPSGTYPYVVVAYQFGPGLFTDWRAGGQYDLDTNFAVPSPVVVPANDTASGINFLVDFENLPPTP